MDGLHRVVVTVHQVFGFRFVIFANDHSPPHVHVFGQGGEAKIDLTHDGGAIISWTRGISRANLRRLLAETRDRHTMLLAAWRKIHG